MEENNLAKQNKNSKPSPCNAPAELEVHGEVYPSIRKLSQAYGVSSATIKQRIGRGLTPEEAVEIPVRKHRSFEPVTIDDITYTSVVALCKAYGINYKTYQARIESGMTPQEAVLAKRQVGRRPAKASYKGVEYNSALEMCSAYGVEYNTYRRRLLRGMTQEQALEVKPRVRTKAPHEGLHGDKYASIADLCAAYGICRSTYLMRVRKGLSREAALTAKPNRRK